MTSCAALLAGENPVAAFQLQGRRKKAEGTPHGAERETMEALLIGLLILVIVVVIAVSGRAAASRSDERWPYYLKKPLTQPEQVLYHRLVKALPECIVLAQVQLSRVLGVQRGFNFHAWNNRINRLSLDFVVCLKDSTVVAAIELDDSSHLEASRREADERKDTALSAAGVPILRWSVSALPDEASIRAAITMNRSQIGPGPKPIRAIR